MKNGSKFHGVVVPMVTPVTASGGLDEAALDRLVDSLLAGGVEGIFVLGTTGEGAHVPRALRKQLVERVAGRVHGSAAVYAGMGDMQPDDKCLAKHFFQVGADAIVVHPPISQPVPAHELLTWFQTLLDESEGAVILYNMPMTTRMTIPLDLVAKLMGHPRLVGLKDSENDAKRHAELIKRFGGQPGFSIFIGVGSLMSAGLRSGASGIVPSVGNLIPRVCHELYLSAKSGDWKAFENHFARMNEVAAVYQKGRTLDQSLAALKTAVCWRGLCDAAVLPPLQALPALEAQSLRQEMVRLQLLN